MQPITVLSLFDGISCGQVALQRVGIPVQKYFASEIDKYAIQVTQNNYPNTIQLGDVTKIDFTQFAGKIDLLMGGSPCQDLSLAGKRKGLQGERSGLFFKFVEALKTIKPRYFLLENNVGMPQEAYEEISELMGCYPIEINSALVSAQNRKRLYWTNIGRQDYNLFGFPTVAIPQPEDKGILLKDVLESGQATKEKTRAIIASIGRTTEREYFKKHQGELIAEPLGLGKLNNNTITPLEKARTLTSYYSTGQTLEHTLQKNIHSMVCEPLRLGHIGDKPHQSTNVYSVFNKSVSLCANGGGLGAKTGLYKIDLPDGDYIIRKLTPIECERLQTLPDNYTDGVSNSQRYKCIGNGWTVDVIAHIFKFMEFNRG